MSQIARLQRSHVYACVCALNAVFVSICVCECLASELYANPKPVPPSWMAVRSRSLSSSAELYSGRSS